MNFSVLGTGSNEGGLICHRNTLALAILAARTEATNRNVVLKIWDNANNRRAAVVQPDGTYDLD